MSIESEITRLVNAKSALRSWLVSKGVGVPSSALLPDMVELLDDVQTGSGTAEQSTVTISNAVGTAITVVAPTGSKSVANGASIAVMIPKGSLVAVLPGTYYANAESGCTLIHTFDGLRYGKVYFFKAAAAMCSISTSKYSSV